MVHLNVIVRTLSLGFLPDGYEINPKCQTDTRLNPKIQSGVTSGSINKQHLRKSGQRSYWNFVGFSFNNNLYTFSLFFFLPRNLSFISLHTGIFSFTILLLNFCWHLHLAPSGEKSDEMARLSSETHCGRWTGDCLHSSLSLIWLELITNL